MTKPLQSLRNFYDLLKTAVLQGSDDRMPALGAALAFYSILSLGPLLLLLLAGLALWFGGDAARGHIVTEFGNLVGQQGTQTITDILDHASPDHKAGTTLLGVVTLLFGASGVFGQLQDSLNIIWRVESKQGAIAHMVWQRVLSFTMVLSTGFLLLTSLVISAALTALESYTTHLFPALGFLMHVADIIISFGIATVLFTMIFKFVPDIKIKWKCVWPGGALTAFLFTVGKFLIGFYIGQSDVGSSYGAAGSAVIVLLWIYYSSQILLFGAEFTRAYATQCETKTDIRV